MARTIRTNDGTVLEVKEGVVLDQNDQTVFTPEQPNARIHNHFQAGKILTWRPGPLAGLLFIALIPVIIIAGAAVAALLAGLMLIAWTIKGTIRALSGK